MRDRFYLDEEIPCDYCELDICDLDNGKECRYEKEQREYDEMKNERLEAIEQQNDEFTEQLINREGPAWDKFVESSDTEHYTIDGELIE